MKNLKIILCLLLALSFIFTAACGKEVAKTGDGKKPSSADKDVLTNSSVPNVGGEIVINGSPGDDYKYDTDVDAVIDAEEGEGYVPEYGGAQEPAYSAGTLTAGELIDSKDYGQWQKLSWGEAQDIWRLYTDKRVSITVKGNDGKGLPGVPVYLEGADGSYIARGCTGRDGQAYLYYNAKSKPAKLMAAYTNDNQTSYAELISVPFAEGTEEYVLTQKEYTPSTATPSLDLMFVVDATGSMGDELEYLKVEIGDVITRSKSTLNMPIRTSVNFYRDVGDEYVVRYFPFEEDIEKVKEHISAQRAYNGGDYPEAVHTALKNAVYDHAWESTNKLMFLVLDAPPHEDPQVIDELNETVMAAAEKGIHIIPVASSGIDKVTEYILRSIALITDGRYTFLTDTSGVGGSHLPPSAAQYGEEKLNDLLVRLICEYCGVKVDKKPIEAPTIQNKTVTEIELPQGEYAEAYELFYEESFEDGSYVKYYFPNIQAYAMTVHYADGTTEPFEKAFEAGRVTIKDLDRVDFYYIAETGAVNSN